MIKEQHAVPRTKLFQRYRRPRLSVFCSIQCGTSSSGATLPTCHRSRRARASLCIRHHAAFRPWQLPVRTNEVAGIAVKDPLEIVLVFRFRFPEIAGRRTSRNDAAPAKSRTHRHRLSFLRPYDVARHSCRRSRNGSSCRGRCLGDSSVVGSWIWKKNSSRSRIGRLVGVEDDLDRLSVGAMISVGRIGHVATGIADSGRNDARDGALSVAAFPRSNRRQELRVQFL